MRRYGIAIVCIAVAVGVRRLLDPVLGNQTPYAILYLAILLTASYGGVGPALLSIVLGALSTNYFLVQPRGSFSMAHMEDQVAQVVYLFVSLGIGLIGGTIRAARRQADAARAHLAAIVESSADAIIGKDLDGIVTSWNACAERLFGYTANEIVGCPISRLIPPDRRNEEESILARIKCGKYAHLSETVRRRKDGAMIDVAITVSPIKNAAGDVVGASQVARDITVRTRAEAALQESERRLRDMMENVQLITLMLDEHGHVRFCNECLLRLTGWQREEVLERDYFDVFIPEDAREEMRHVYRALTAGSSTGHHVNEIITRSGERRLLAWNNTSLKDSAGKIVGVASIAEDITERSRIETALRESEAKFRQLSESLPQLIWTCQADGACDYLSPQWVDYTGIPEHDQLGLGWLQQIHPDDRSRTITAWKSMADSGVSVDDELRIRRKDGVYRWFRARAVALRDEQGHVVKWFRTNTDIEDQRQMEAQLRLAQRMESAPWLAELRMTSTTSWARSSATAHRAGRPHADASGSDELVHQRLAGDGWEKRPYRYPPRWADARRRGGAGRVESPAWPLCAPVRRRQRQRDGRRDAGAHLRAVLYHEASRPGHGPWLVGRAWDRGDARRGVTVKSQPGTGTTFSLYFPAVEAPQLNIGSEAIGSEPLPAGGGQYVLFLDDEESLVFLVSRLLKRLGYRVSGYTRPEEALAAVRANPEQFDLVVTDLNMPRISGLEVADELSRLCPDLPVVIASGFITEDLRAAASRAGVRQLFYKPNTVDELCRLAGPSTT